MNKEISKRKWEDNFMFFKIIFKELFGFKAETQEELDEYDDDPGIKENLVLNETSLPMHGIGEDNFFLNNFKNSHHPNFKNATD
ncbi:MAG: hypothetical protein HOG03_23120 [Desulfobacula sp.]|jgi:hypothetical protein|uniref:hypothetical protein n=1 Tax=Desulfobacula sp. TaxID=2593537 RepID=UPI001DAAEB43|nr:hypothetical protein [Desulfobacula sp.]MBT3424198.1 hypothetical protein [Bacteroidota bacterium]MBT3807456.1 hypothetical protein [Desulfobacula sp.]MBT4027590.1 hypothetical protein [Desulfobacula sp.]MBT4201310.1 hypothetical protein [Desulfobacula sp.]